MRTLRNISIRGRVAIGIECLELMIKDEFKTDIFNYVSSFLWRFVENENINIADWEELSSEIAPNCICDTIYNDADFEIIGKDYYEELKGLYSNIGEDCKKMIDKIIEIASLHFYTTIPSYSPETAKLTNEILSLCKKSVGYTPNVSDYKEMSFSQNRGWGISQPRK